jgi:hypothetical protein
MPRYPPPPSFLSMPRRANSSPPTAAVLSRLAPTLSLSPQLQCLPPKKAKARNVLGLLDRGGALGLKPDALPSDAVAIFIGNSDNSASRVVRPLSDATNALGSRIKVVCIPFRVRDPDKQLIFATTLIGTSCKIAKRSLLPFFMLLTELLRRRCSWCAAAPSRMSFKRTLAKL